jgi:hypothetical protein
MLVSQIVSAVADELNDLEPGNEYVRWPLPFLFSYIDQALRAIAPLKPDLFTIRIPYTLSASSVQTLPASLVDLKDILGTLDRFGRIVRNVNKSSYDLTKYQNQSCLSDSYSFYVHKDDPRAFYIDPPPKSYPQVTMILLGRQNVQPVAALTQDIIFPGGSIDDYFNPIVDWCLYRSFAKENQSESNAAKSEKHYKAFYDFFNIVPKIRTTDATLQSQGQSIE